jgi:hypothetical protein
MTNLGATRIPGMMATLASYEGLFGPYHPQTLGLTIELAVALCSAGRWDEGRRLLQWALLNLTQHYGMQHPVRMRALEAWAALLRRQGDWKAALPIQRELLESRVQLLGEDHPDSKAARQDLSAVLDGLADALAIRQT